MNDMLTILQGSIVPVALISGVGLLLLGMTNRFARIMDRIREFHRQDEKAQTDILYRRARLLRLSIVFSVASLIGAGLLMILIFVTYFVEMQLPILIVFVLSILCLVISLLLYLRDFTLAFKAMKIELSRL